MKLYKLSTDSISKTIALMKLNQIYTNLSAKTDRLNLIKFVKDFECNIGKKLLHDTLIMEGFVDIVNGNTVIHGKNSIVDQGLAAIINWASGNTSSGAYLGSLNWGGTSPSNTYMVIGSDTTTHTANGTTTLATPIGTAPGTRPNSQSGINSNPATGQWQVQWTATWNAGTIPAVTLGEVGLYLQTQPALQTFQAAAGTGTYLFSRMASADGKFTAFTINNTVPLSIAWTFRLTYAI